MLVNNNSVIIRATKAQSTKEENLVNMMRLERDLLKLGFPFTTVDGNYQGSMEKSFLVVSGMAVDLRKSLIDLCQKYGQDSILYIHNDATTEFINMDGTSKFSGKFTEATQSLDHYNGWTVIGDKVYIINEI